MGSNPAVPTKVLVYGTMETRPKYIALFFALAVGCFLRFSHPSVMEYKNDERLNYEYSQYDLTTQPIPWIGVRSGVGLLNPGFGGWLYIALGRIPGVKLPSDLIQCVHVVSVFGILALLGFILTSISPLEQEPWLWAVAFQCVNPLILYYDRKLWLQAFLPLFLAGFLYAYWRRSKKSGAFLWGFIGVLSGQVHMSGFFLSLAFLITTFFRELRGAKLTQWRYYFFGSALAVLPMVPWIVFMMNAANRTVRTSFWNEVLQFRIVPFFISDPFGLHLGNTLGLFRGPSIYAQLSDFLRYPHSTGLVGAAHVLLLVFCVVTVFFTLKSLVQVLRVGIGAFFKVESNAAFFSATFIYGTLLTLTGALIRRYYLAFCSVFEFSWVARQWGKYSKNARRYLLAIWFLQAFISYQFVQYIVDHHGSTQGDFGESYSGP